jgi:hypothetical protein
MPLTYCKSYQDYKINTDVKIIEETYKDVIDCDHPENMFDEVLNCCSLCGLCLKEFINSDLRYTNLYSKKIKQKIQKQDNTTVISLSSGTITYENTKELIIEKRKKKTTQTTESSPSSTESNFKQTIFEKMRQEYPNVLFINTQFEPFEIVIQDKIRVAQKITLENEDLIKEKEINKRVNLLTSAAKEVFENIDLSGAYFYTICCPCLNAIHLNSNENITSLTIKAIAIFVKNNYDYFTSTQRKRDHKTALFAALLGAHIMVVHDSNFDDNTKECLEIPRIKIGRKPSQSKFVKSAYIKVLSDRLNISSNSSTRILKEVLELFDFEL